MTVKDYRPANNFCTNSDARAIGPELMALAAKGQSSAFHIVEAARRPSSAMHKYIEWNDEKAAEQFRLQQARNIANHILVTVESSTGEERTLRAFHAVHVEVAGQRSRDKHYLPIEVIKTEPEYVERVIDDAWRQLQSWRDRYASYRDHFGPIFPAIEEMLVEETTAA